MKSSSEGCSFAVVAAMIITGIETTICIFVGVKSKDPTHPFFYMQKMNFTFFMSIAVLLIVTGLNLIPMISFIFNCENVPYPIVRFLFSRLIVTILMSCFHLIASICLFVLFLILQTKSDDYFSISDYKLDSNVQGFIDSVQNTLICCGKTHGVRDWNGSVPNSCCQQKTCPKYRLNWPCFPMLKYALGSPMLVGFIVILINICCSFFCLWTNYKQVHFFSRSEENKPMMPPVHPTPSVHPRASPCYMTENGLDSRPYSEFKMLDVNKKRHRRKASYEYDRFFSDRALLDARRGSGYRKFGSPTYKVCDSGASKRVSFSLPPDRSRKLSDSAKHDVSEVLSRNLFGVMEGCITQKRLEIMKDSDGDLKEDHVVVASLDGGDKSSPVPIPADKQSIAAAAPAAAKEKPEMHSEQKRKPQKHHHKEAKPKPEKTALETGSDQKRPISPIQALKGRLKKRRERKESSRQSAEESKPDTKGQ